MATYYKPQSPIQSGEDFIYPLTTTDQVMVDKDTRLNAVAVYLGNINDSTDTTIYGNNATTLGGIAAEDYALKTDTAPDSSKLGGQLPSFYASTEEVNNVKDEKVDKSSVVNNFTTTQDGFVADARALKNLNDRMGTPLNAAPSIMLSKRDNWNSVNPGVYYFNTWAHDGGVNYPKGGMGIVMFIKAYDGTYGAQYCISDSWLGVRVLSASKWGDWKYLALT